MGYPLFKSARKLAAKADAYFSCIEGEYHVETNSGKEIKIWDREAEPATIAGLALFLGFNSRQEFEDYEQNGKFGEIVKRGRLQVEADYEKKLHHQSPSGAIFALKNLGWKEKDDKGPIGNIISCLKIEMIETGPKPAGDEKEVIL